VLRCALSPGGRLVACALSPGGKLAGVLKTIEEKHKDNAGDEPAEAA